MRRYTHRATHTCFLDKEEHCCGRSNNIWGQSWRKTDVFSSSEATHSRFLLFFYYYYYYYYC